MKPKTVVIVEDDERLQKQLIKILESAPDIKCLYVLSSAEEALVQIPQNAPDVVLMDINLPGMSGIDCLAELGAQLPKTEIVMLTAYEEEDNIFRSLKAGASGYLLKSSRADVLLDAIRDVHSGGAPFSSHIARKVVQYFQSEKQIASDNDKLSPREREILNLIATGYVYKEAAEKLGISSETVRTYVKRICVKMHVRSRAEAISKYRAR
ncbi:MAG TPA: response regulator transcription factor [Rariglobus sp.]|jgi:DNA-binding NarL/FixJ family response regulator|nr:response regulator transcription factor [Rariglobus sp.]